MLSEDLFVDVVEPAATRKKRLSFAPTLASIVAYSIRAPPVDVGACAIQTCVKDSEDSDTADSTSLWDLKTRHWSDSTTLLTNRDSSDTNNNVFLSSLAFYPQDSYIRGQAMVRNLAFEKTLSVRYSLDDWLSFEDVKGIFVGPVSSHRWTSPSAAHKASDITKDLSTSPSWDLFEFAIPLPLLHSHTSVKLDTRRQSSRPRVKATLSFCLQYTVGGQEFWDNHHGKDYKIQLQRRGGTQRSRHVSTSDRESSSSLDHSPVSSLKFERLKINPGWSPPRLTPNRKAPAKPSPSMGEDPLLSPRRVRLVRNKNNHVCKMVKDPSPPAVYSVFPSSKSSSNTNGTRYTFPPSLLYSQSAFHELPMSSSPC